MRKLLIVIGLLFSLGIHALEWSDATQVSLLTCTPGEELYARYGHTAIRIYDPENGTDWVFNYGIFDFNTDHFYWKFVRGETWYMLGAATLDNFLFEYRIENRPVYEQVLNLTTAQREQMIDALLVNYLPENRTYLYNFVFDNCATRPYRLIQSILGDSIRSTYQGSEGVSYRRFIQRYTGVGSWADFGIELLFGARSQHKMQGEERLFLPEELMFYLSEATLPDGTPVVRKEAIEHFVIRPIPWYKTWYFGISLVVVALIAISIYDRRRGKASRWLDILFLVLYGLLLALVCFLTFFSIHPLVGFGIRLFLILLVYICIRFIAYFR